MDGETIRAWIPGLLKRQADAAEALVRHLGPAMLNLARRLLHDSPTGESDEEDVVNAAFYSFIRRAGENQFPHLHDEHDLWRLLQTIVTRKALNQRRRQHRRRDHDCLPAELAAPRVDPAWIVENQDKIQWVFEWLGDEELQQIATLLLEGYTNLEISIAMSRSVSTIERRLALIRSLWEPLATGHGEAQGDCPDAPDSLPGGLDPEEQS